MENSCGSNKVSLRPTKAGLWGSWTDTSKQKDLQQRGAFLSGDGNTDPQEPLDDEYQLLLVDTMFKTQFYLYFYNMKCSLQSFPRQCVLEWRQAWRRAVTLHKSTLHSGRLLKANDSQGEKVKKSKF